MKFADLQSALEEVLPQGARAVVWAPASGFSDRAYNIVPVESGGFEIYASDGRDKFFPLKNSGFATLVFTTEDEVCDYIWGRVQESLRPATTRMQQPTSQVDRSQ
jgi:hypothetical protein